MMPDILILMGMLTNARSACIGWKKDYFLPVFQRVPQSACISEISMIRKALYPWY
jgi:hypothetical protein